MSADDARLALAAEALSPIDGRYRLSDPELFEQVSAFLSEEAFVRYLLRVEVALTRALSRRGLCDQSVADEIADAAQRVTPQAVWKEEQVTQHNIRALVNVLQREVSERARPFVHLTATSYDVMDTARALQFQDSAREVVVPALKELAAVWIEIARREAGTIQAGRTHGQHAVPITFGFAMAEHVSRLGERIEALERRAGRLVGKMSGAVGAYNAGSLFFDDPVAFEAEALAELGLKAADHSTQIVPAEYLLDYLHTAVSALGVLASAADDIRHLQRTEIAEVGEAFDERQVGSSTMPHKRNPWNFEHVKSLWKTFMPRMATVYMDQLSEHQRDLTNSASGRFYGEIVFGLAAAARRMTRVCKRLVVDRERMRKNFELTRETVIAEPLYILLAAAGHPDAHEAVRTLTLRAERERSTVRALLAEDAQLRPYLERLSPQQRRVLEDPSLYVGRAKERALAVCELWSVRLGLAGAGR